MRWLDLAFGDTRALRRTWDSAEPFSHIVIDDVVVTEALDELRAAFVGERHGYDRGELHEFLASSDALQQPALRDFAAELGSPEMLATIGAITGKAVHTVEMRSYIYLAGAYLLPHTDFRPGVGRQVAYAYYLTLDGGCTGGELELFACTVESGDIVATRSAQLIAQCPNRLVLFDVTATSLHQVREVTSGARCSFAGWFS